jgi:uncharacterized membrane protein YqhA
VIRLLMHLRWLAVMIAAFSALNAVAMVAVGVVRAFSAYRIIVEGPPWTDDHRPGAMLAESIDAFLLAMVFVVFSIGTTTLFLVRNEKALESVPAWMRVHDLAELKFLVWEAILAALVVASVAGEVGAVGERSWTMLVLPVATLILAAGLFLTRRSR